MLLLAQIQWENNQKQGAHLTPLAKKQGMIFP